MPPILKSTVRAMLAKARAISRRHLQNITAAFRRHQENDARISAGIGRTDMRPAFRRKDGPHKHPNPWAFKNAVWRHRHGIAASPTIDRRRRAENRREAAMLATES